MKFKWLLFDFDNTLVDFSSAAKSSLWQTFSDFGTNCNEEIEAQYKLINSQVWTAFERGEISAAHLRVKRFADLFALLPSAPTTPETFSVRFLENLVQLSTAYEGVVPLLDQLKQQYQLGIITNGLKEVQRPRLQLLDLTDYFDSITVSDEIGVAKPQAAFFDHVYQSLADVPSKDQLLVIGDSLHSDIRGGIDYGLSTCWINHGKANTTDMQPDFSIKNVLELPDILG